MLAFEVGLGVEAEVLGDIAAEHQPAAANAVRLVRVDAPVGRHVEVGALRRPHLFTPELGVAAQADPLVPLASQRPAHHRRRRAGGDGLDLGDGLVLLGEPCGQVLRRNRSGGCGRRSLGQQADVVVLLGADRTAVAQYPQQPEHGLVRGIAGKAGAAGAQHQHYRDDECGREAEGAPRRDVSPKIDMTATYTTNTPSVHIHQLTDV